MPERRTPRGTTPRQPSRSGRHDKAAAVPARAVGRFVKRAAPILKKVAKVAAPVASARLAAKKAAPRKPVGKAPKGYNPLTPARVSEILERLDERYPAATCALHHKSAWELLAATILSAQCTDVRVNMVTPVLFEKYPTVEAFAALKPEELEPDIRSTGFFRNKSKSLVGAARKLVSEFGGEVPRTMDELLQLPGVARKTANVVLGTYFKIADGVVVDTHVTRISRRLELTRNTDPQKIEQDLMNVLPRDKWIVFAHQIILHGRAICVARSPKCADCPLENLCHAADKTWSTVEIHNAAKP
ncbi:MAG: endonuclease III [Acidobacteriota bacterium]|nr:endonuclease III [Acidobacteriota bacterium]